MTDPMHTLSGWEMMPEETDKSYIRIRGSVLGGRFKIANVLTPEYNFNPELRERELEETRAIARLIIAAPHLLDFARHVAAIKLGGPIQKKALAVIAIATGEKT